MVVAAGGENPKLELELSRRTVGIRIQRRRSALPRILEYRQRLLEHETYKVIGSRQPSTSKLNTFGARYFQPHISLLKASSGIDRDLTKPGKSFRDRFDHFTFDRFVIDIIERQVPISLEQKKSKLFSRPTTQ